MNERVLALRDAVVKITQMLSGQGIEVTQRGVNAYVQCDKVGKPTLVNLPYLPDNATEELVLAIQGFLDHEVAHILFSDFTLVDKANKMNVHSMWNMIEDARIEKAMAKRFAGSGHNLSVTGKFFLDKFTVPMLKEAAGKGDANKAVGVLMVPLIRALSGQFLFKEFMRDKMTSMQPVVDLIGDLEAKLEACDSSQAALDLAVEIETRLRKGKPPAPKDGEPGDEEGDGEGGATVKVMVKGKPPAGAKPKKETKAGKPKDEEKDEDEESKGTGAGKGEEDEESKDETDEEGTGAGKGEEKKDEDEEKGASDGDSDSEEEDDDGASAAGDEDGDEGDGAMGGDGDEGDGSVPETAEIPALGSAILSAIDKENANGYDASLSTLISNAAVTSAKSSPYVVYTKEGDKVEPLHIGSGYQPRMYTELADKVDHMVGPLQKDLERAISARSLATWESGRRSGRLHAANLSRLAVGDPRVFRKKHETTSKDVAVELVVDASGSMGGAKIHLATQAAYALSSVLERLNIPHEVICFTTGEIKGDPAKVAADERKIGKAFTRSESLYMPIIKGFNERLKTQVKERFGWLPNSKILRNNVDGECIEIAARRLLGRREAGKVMIVLSDGSPNAHGDTYALCTHLKKVVKDVEKAGVKTVGIGIQTTTVQQFYPRNIVINNVAELPTRVIKELRHMLIN